MLKLFKSKPHFCTAKAQLLLLFLFPPWPEQNEGHQERTGQGFLAA